MKRRLLTLFAAFALTLPSLLITFPASAASCYYAWDVYHIYYGEASSTLNVNWCSSGGQITSASSGVTNSSSNVNVYYVYDGPYGYRSPAIPATASTAYWTVYWDSMNSTGLCEVHLAITSYASGYWTVAQHYTSGQCAS